MSAKDRWTTNQGIAITQAVAEAVRGGAWTDAIYEFTQSDPKSLAVNLSGIKLRDMDLSGADFSSLNLQGADFTGSTMTNSDLQFAILEDAVFDKADLRDANLVGCQARRASFRSANLFGAHLMSADLSSAVFRNANLRKASMSGTLATEADFRGADLNDVSKNGANWAGAQMGEIAARTDEVPKVQARPVETREKARSPSPQTVLVASAGQELKGERASGLSEVDLLRRVPLFSLLTNEQLASVASAVIKRRFKRGDAVVVQGKRSDTLFVLLNGRARVLTADSRGREVILAVLQAGHYVGEMSLIDNEPHSATVKAEIQTDMLLLSRESFTSHLPDSSNLSYGILRGLVQRLRRADRQIESLALLDVYGRVARSLMDMAVQEGEVSVIRSKVSRQDLAKVVGASREMVSRVMKDLEDRGIVETQQNGNLLIKQRIE